MEGRIGSEVFQAQLEAKRLGGPQVKRLAQLHALLEIGFDREEVALAILAACVLERRHRVRHGYRITIDRVSRYGVRRAGRIPALRNAPHAQYLDADARD